MQDKIGYVAGNIWQHLERKGEMTPKKLSTVMKESPNVVYLALGWLARENKIEFQPTKSTFRVKLGGMA